MASLTLEHVSKTYRGGGGVSGLSLEVADGELVVLTGPSGAGKTTILRLIAGLERPDSGTLRISGRVVNNLPPRARQVAMVFQQHNLYPHLTVRENLAFGAHSRRKLLRENVLSVTSEDQRVEEVANILSITHLLDRRPAELAGGESQRVALGRALVRRPDVFLLDEPLSQLDLPLRIALRGELHLLHQRICATMIHVTHDQIEAMNLAQRLVVLHRGTIQQVGKPDVVYNRPCNRFVAGFIGWPPMNFIEGRLAGEDSTLTFLSDDRSWLLAGVGWKPQIGQEVTLGIRPEHVVVGSSGAMMEVIALESFGATRFATMARDSLRLVGKISDGQQIAIGQNVAVGFDMQQVHWFDRMSGVNLAVPSG